MQAVILAGGKGTRLSEETQTRPKPMVEIGGKPILWHIMKYYKAHGVDEFIICTGHKAEMIEDYFAYSDEFNVICANTGEDTQTGGRLKLIQKLIKGTFLMTYGDGLSNVNIGALVNFHKHHGKKATVTAVHPPARFGALELLGHRVTMFIEKPIRDFINGGFFVLEPEVLDYIKRSQTLWEKEPLQTLAREGELHAFKHTGFWQCMDTLREKQQLQEHWERGAPWKIW